MLRVVEAFELSTPDGVMIKIDFHMHTVATKSDAHFEFDLEVLKRYTKEAGIDAIAITNHNMFDLVQYRTIKAALSTIVYPGIEINLGDGHLLLIADGSDLDDFAQRCDEIKALVSDPSIYISMETFQGIYPDLHKYILIPHYDKYPAVSGEFIEKLLPHVTAGEVASAKKFIYCLKDSKSLVPVYFSDSRMAKGQKKMPIRQTYLSCEDATFSSIKNCLTDRVKVSLSPEEGKSLFEVLENGQRLSTGLNVVLGERSSGKSHTLNQIYAEQTEFGKVKYIEQFSLVERDGKDDEKKFDKLLSEKHSLVSREYPILWTVMSSI